jgi:hypothetical protein
MATNQTLIPIFTTRGDCGGFLVYPNIFNRQGEWIGWVTPDRQVFATTGQWVGWLSAEPRILRKRAVDYWQVRRTPPPPPRRINTPALTPLPPMMAELSYDTIDVLDDDPDLMPTLDFDKLRPDLD